MRSSTPNHVRFGAERPATAALAGTDIAEVDCSLTTGELQELLDGAGLQLAGLGEGVPLRLAGAAGSPEASAPGQEEHMELDASLDPAVADSSSGVGMAPAMDVDGPQTAAGSGSGSGSGGYLEHVFRAAALQLHGIQVPPGPLQMRTVRNQDFREVELADPSEWRDHGRGRCRGGGRLLPKTPPNDTLVGFAQALRPAQTLLHPSPFRDVSSLTALPARAPARPRHALQTPVGHCCASPPRTGSATFSRWCER